MNRIVLKRAPAVLGCRYIAVTPTRTATLIASSNTNNESVYSPASLGKMTEYDEWKTLVKAI